MSAPTEPTFRYLPPADGDSAELWWSHTCDFPDLVADPTGGTWRHATRLPLGPSGWTVTQTEPLTVTPSILCESCKTHGFIRDGKWVKA